MMKKNNVHEIENSEKKDLTFLEKYKTDKKYKAKVELIGYGVLILVLIIYLNIASLSSSSGVQNTILNDGLTAETNDDDTSLEKKDLLNQLQDNYEYDVRLSLQYLENDVKTEKVVRYFGKRYGEEAMIEREVGEEKNTYFRVGSMYYKNLENGEQLIEEDEVYNFVDKIYIELDEIKKYLDVASLDHVTDYSSGKKEYVYHLKVREVAKTYTGDEEIEFSLESVGEVLSMKVDYSNLMKVMEEDILECSVEYVYQNIGKVGEFHVLEEKSDTGNIE